jgi:hypothetical protein
MLSLPFSFPAYLHFGNKLARVCHPSYIKNSLDRATTRAIESKLRLCVLRRDHYNCCSCGTAGDEITLEIHPFAAGIDDPNALITLCARCSRELPQ